MSGGTTQIAQDAECACPTGWDYCPELQMCIPTGSPCAVSNSICYDLTMVPTSSSS
ncbi:MAG: hypothetical protein Q8O99_05020 [bacterium]|nr:hypothetical protein [bacterium]